MPFKAPLVIASTLFAANAWADPLPDLLLREFQSASGVTGMAAAVIDGQGKLWHAEAGLADRERKLPVTAQTEFRLASVSKFVTTVILANQVERKVIDLSLPVHHYLPDYPKKSHPFTSLHLATHTSGTTHYQMPMDLMIGQRSTAYASVAEGIAIFKDRPLVNVPGTAFLYSSYGFNLLSAVMEKAAGQEFTQQIAALGKRANAPSLQVEHFGMVGKHWSKLYDTDGDEIPRGNISYGWAGGSMIANAGDVARVALLVLDPSYVSPATLAQLGTPARFSDGRVVMAERYTQATGWRLGNDGSGRSYLHHSGTTQGARSHVAVYPKERIAVALLSNTNFVSAMDGVGESLAEAVTVTNAAGPCRTGSKPFKGKYQDRDIVGKLEFGTRDGACTWSFSIDNYFGEKMLGSRKLSQLNAYSRGGEGNLYLVTPIGIFPGKASPTGVDFSIMGRSATFTF